MEKIKITLATENIPLSMQIAQVSEKLNSDPMKHRIRLTKFQRNKGSLHLEYEILTLDKPTKSDNLDRPEKQDDIPPELAYRQKYSEY